MSPDLQNSDAAAQRLYLFFELAATFCAQPAIRFQMFARNTSVEHYGSKELLVGQPIQVSSVLARTWPHLDYFS